MIKRAHSVLLVSFFLVSSLAAAATREEVDLHSRDALNRLYEQSPAARELAAKARGILVFPQVYKAGFGVGGEYGEGKLLVDSSTAGYYSTAAASIGFQLGAQRKSQVVLFMTEDALNGFLNADGWEAGVDGSVALATLGAGGAIDTNTVQNPIIGFIFSNEGLMYNLTFEGSKITRIDR